MFKQIFKRVGVLSVVIGATTGVVVATNPAVAQDFYIYCNTYCSGECEMTGMCIDNLGGVHGPWTGYKAECCSQ